MALQILAISSTPHVLPQLGLPTAALEEPAPGQSKIQCLERLCPGMALILATSSAPDTLPWAPQQQQQQQQQQRQQTLQRGPLRLPLWHGMWNLWNLSQSLDSHSLPLAAAQL
jgi:hypothetical protein